jgi:hypothetical protein
MLEGTALYVGMGSMLLRRVGGSHKQADEAMALCDSVLLYPCVDIKAATKLEKLLITRLQPAYNRNYLTHLKRPKRVSSIDFYDGNCELEGAHEQAIEG